MSSAVERGPQPLAEWTTFQLGGPCDQFYDCRTAAQAVATLTALRAAGQVPLILGGGSNLLVADAGWPGPVLRLADTPCEPQWDGDTVTFEAGCALTDCVQALAQAGRAGLDFAAGIPGTLGGALVGNAGAFGRAMHTALLTVELLEANGHRHWVAAAHLDFAYRSSALKRRKALVLRARFHTPCAPAAELLADYDRLLALRRSKHPDWRREPCAGSVFRNPTPGAPQQPSAGWYLEQVGAPAWLVGGARIFSRHANIIVKADPSCRAAHVLELMTRMRQAVAERFGLLLEPEILCVGLFPNRPGWARGPDSALALEAAAE